MIEYLLLALVRVEAFLCVLACGVVGHAVHHKEWPVATIENTHLVETWAPCSRCGRQVSSARILKEPPRGKGNAR